MMRWMKLLLKRKKETHALVNEQVQILSQLCLAEKQHQNLWGILFMCFAAGLLNKSERQKEKKNEKNQTTCLLKVKYIAMKPENP